MMRMSVNKRYLKLPIRYEAMHKQIAFFHEGKLVYDLEARIDGQSPDVFYYVDLGRFAGCELDIEITPSVQMQYVLCDTQNEKELYQEKYRPSTHFTAPRGWHNDPNGLIWYNGVYHLFYQHNPIDRTWENMHWGHAVSRDLLHWENRPIALFPDELGAVFSGSAIVDRQNLTGLKENENDVILLYYTAWPGLTRMAPGKRSTQCLAYSTDGGVTFKKYAQNPIIDQIVEGNRDPKVIEWEGRYYMALYLAHGRYAILGSSNLLKWRKLQEFVLPEDRECPDLYPLRIEGEKEIRWIFSGANDHYYVGRLCENGFQPEQPIRRLQYGKDSDYAAQTFSNLPDATGHMIRISWNRSRIPDSCFVGSMSTPVEMKLRRIDDSLCLCALPIEGWIHLRKNARSESALALPAGERRCWELKAKAHDIQISVSPNSGAFTVRFLGLLIQVYPAANMLQCREMTMPLYKNSSIKLRILTDTNSLEIYVDQGEAIMTVPHVSDYSLNSLEIGAEDQRVMIDQLQMYELENIWLYNDTNANDEQGGTNHENAQEHVDPLPLPVDSAL